MNEWRFYRRWIRCSRDWLYFFIFFSSAVGFHMREEVFCFRWASNEFHFFFSARVRSTKTFRVRLNLWEDSLKKNRSRHCSLVCPTWPHARTKTHTHTRCPCPIALPLHHFRIRQLLDISSNGVRSQCSRALHKAFLSWNSDFQT